MRSNSGSFFGTDGIRGRVGETPITVDFFRRLATVVGCIATSINNRKVLIGRDTRESGLTLESALVAGFIEAGVDVYMLGILPTPAVAYQTRARKAAAGVVVSASHNPYVDNGVKFFNADGTKWSDELQQDVDEALSKEKAVRSCDKIGKFEHLNRAGDEYVEFCLSSFNAKTNLAGLRIVIDCAHGAASRVAPKVFRELGADVIEVGTEPNGRNINVDCGSTDLATLQRRVSSELADLGIAFDGDADRVQMVTRDGDPVDGDQLLYVIAKHRMEQGSLVGGVVGSEMSNVGLETALQDLAIPFHRAPVGDRHVYGAMTELGWFLGGEGSGHVICRDKTTTGDGIISALEVLAAMRAMDASLAELVAGMARYPQRLINVRVPNANEVVESEAVQNAVRNFGENRFDRVLIRPSGTEPLLRIMVEGREADAVEREADRFASLVRSVAEKVN